MGKMILFIVVGVLGIVYQESIKLEFYTYQANSAAVSGLETICRQSASCQDDLAKSRDLCAASAAVVGTKDGGNALKLKLLPCLQKAYRKRECKNEDRCVANVEASFPMCAATSYPTGSDPEDPERSIAFDNCMREGNAIPRR